MCTWIWVEVQVQIKVLESSIVYSQCLEVDAATDSWRKKAQFIELGEAPSFRA